jgi:hypothetical protein
MILLYSCMILTLFEKNHKSQENFIVKKKILLKIRFMMPRCRISGFEQKKLLTIFSKMADGRHFGNLKNRTPSFFVYWYVVSTCKFSCNSIHE